MVYKKIEYREFNSLEEIVRWEELNLDKKYKAIRGDLIYSHDPTAQAILQYSGFLYRPLNYYGRISSNAIIRCGNKKYIKYITDLVEFMYDFPIPENIVTYRFIHRKDFSQLRIAARQEYGLVKGWTSLLEKGFTSTTAKNIEKTRKLCGEKAADFCERNNISSCWSAEIADAHDYYDPWDAKL